MRTFLSTLIVIILSQPLPLFSADNKGLSEYLAALELEYKSVEKPDYKAAFFYYQAAAKAGSREALLALARLSAPGGSFEQSPEFWKKCLIEAARTGWAEPAFTLGQALEEGLIKDGKLNPMDFYFQAALSGHAQAARRLGELYLAGSDKNEKDALMWLALAAENHDAEAPLILGRIYYSKNDKAAHYWLEKAESPEASYLLGEIYLRERRFVEAVNSFNISADQNYAPAHLALGLINLENEFGRRPNARQALKHFKVSAQAGLEEAAYQLGKMYIYGQATPKDSITGAFWIHKAGEKHEKALSEYEKLRNNFTPGQKKRLDRMIAEGLPPRGMEAVE